MVRADYHQEIQHKLNPYKKIYFARFDNNTLLSVEPKGDNQIYVLAWTSLYQAVNHVQIARLPEDATIFSMLVHKVIGFVAKWESGSQILLDRDFLGGGLILDVDNLKKGVFTVTKFQGELPQAFDVGEDKGSFE